MKKMVQLIVALAVSGCYGFVKDYHFTDDAGFGAETATDADADADTDVDVDTDTDVDTDADVEGNVVDAGEKDG